MKNKGFFKTAAALLAALVLLGGFSVTAYADGGDSTTMRTNIARKSRAAWSRSPLRLTVICR